MLKSSSRDIEKEIRILQEKMEGMHRFVIDELRKGHDIYQAIERRETIKRCTDADISALVDFYRVIRQEVFSVWDETYDSLSVRQYLYLVLRDMELNDREMAEILGVTEVAVRSTRSRLKKRLRNTPDGDAGDGR